MQLMFTKKISCIGLEISLLVQAFARFGTHPIVCCPSYSSSAIFFPTDPSHPDYGANFPEYENNYDEYGPSYDTDIQVQVIPKVNFLLCYGIKKKTILPYNIS